MVVVAGETWLQGGAKRPGDFDTWPANLGRCWDYPIFSMEKNGRVIWNGSFLFVCLFVFHGSCVSQTSFFVVDMF